MIDTQSAREARKQFPLALMGGIVIVALVFGGVALMSKNVHVVTPPVPKPMTFGAAEQAYAPRIHYDNIQLAKSSNLLNQQFTYINGTVSNNGDRPISQLAMTVEFADDLANKEVVLRDTEPIINATDQPLAPGQKRDFSVTLDKFPDTWNQQMPNFHTSGLVFQ
jgi:hypothetical protein